MYLVKIVGDKHINVFTANDFEVYISCAKLYRHNASLLEIPLEEDDIVYIMDANGDTVDSFSPRLNPWTEPKD